MKIELNNHSLKIIPETHTDIAILNYAIGLKEIKDAVLVKRIEEFEGARLNVYAEIEFGQPVLEVKYKAGDKESAIGFIQQEEETEEEGEGCHDRKR